jgi:hypothetical protein
MHHGANGGAIVPAACSGWVPFGARTERLAAFDVTHSVATVLHACVHGARGIRVLPEQISPTLVCDVTRANVVAGME